MSASWTVRGVGAVPLDPPEDAVALGPPDDDPLATPPLVVDAPLLPPPENAGDPPVPPDELTCELPVESWAGLPGRFGPALPASGPALPPAERLVSLAEQALRASAAIANKYGERPGSFMVDPSESTRPRARSKPWLGGR